MKEQESHRLKLSIIKSIHEIETLKDRLSRFLNDGHCDNETIARTELSVHEILSIINESQKTIGPIEISCEIGSASVIIEILYQGQNLNPLDLNTIKCNEDMQKYKYNPGILPGLADTARHSFDEKGNYIFLEIKRFHPE